MDNRYKYQKSFLIFDEEDSGFGTEQRPLGHVKIEIRDGNGKLFCQVSNLVEDNGNVEYRLFLIKADEAFIVPVLVGNFVLKRNRGELEWNFDPCNISKTGMAFDRFNVFAVLANQKGRQNNSVLCPLAAYKDGKVEWRQKLNNVLKEEKTNEEVLNLIQKDVDIINNKKVVNIENESSKKEEKTEHTNFTQKNQSVDSGKENEFVVAKEPYGAEKDELVAPNYKELSEKSANAMKKSSAEDQMKLNASENQIEEKPPEDQENAKSYSSYDGTKLFDMYTGDSKDNSNLNSNLNANLNTNCLNCIFFNNKNTDKLEIKEYGFEEWSKQFDLTFERYSPFSVKRTDYNWWKVVSPVHLNNILYKFGIKIPVLFNPLVLMAHYKYKHLIVGIYKDEKRDRDYIVCGIPGVYWVDEKPFGNACRWAQVEGNTTTYGAFGYWIVYINPKTGKILAIEE